MGARDSQPIGKGHADAWLRGGLTELSQILPAFPDSVRPIQEYGLFGTALPQEVFEQRHALDIAPQETPELERGLDLELER